MKIIFGSDHRGMAQREALLATLAELGDVVDVGQLAPELTDYVEVSEKFVEILKERHAPGVIICGTGIGISIVANKYAGVSAARCVSVQDAVDCRQVNNSNVLCLSAKTPVELNQQIVKAFFRTEFTGDDRPMRRLAKIAELEQRNFK